MKCDDTFYELVNRIITTKYPTQFLGLSTKDDVIIDHCTNIIIKQKNKIIIDDDFIKKFLSHFYVEVDSFLVNALLSVFYIYQDIEYNKIYDAPPDEDGDLMKCDITFDFDVLHYEELLYRGNDMNNGLKTNLCPKILVNLIKYSKSKKITINKHLLGKIIINTKSHKSLLDILGIPSERRYRDVNKLIVDRLIKINNINVKKIKNEEQ